jgi:miniconductance mechanosensitive channel
MIEKWIAWFREVLINVGLSDKWTVFIENLTVILVTIGLAFLADFIVKRIIIGIITRLVKRSKNKWDDIFLQRKVFNRLAHLAPAIIVYYSLDYIFNADKLVTFLENVTQAYMVIVVLLVIDSVINALHEIYHSLPVSKGRSSFISSPSF